MQIPKSRVDGSEEAGRRRVVGRCVEGLVEASPELSLRPEQVSDRGNELRRVAVDTGHVELIQERVVNGLDLAEHLCCRRRHILRVERSGQGVPAPRQNGHHLLAVLGRRR